VDRPARHAWLVGAALFAGTILLFSRSLGCGFVNYDDPRFILDNPHVQAGFTAESVAWAFSGDADYWHPLTWFSHMLDWRLYGANAAGHHLTSVLWHALNAVLAFLVMRRLTGGFWTSAFSAALFAWHPLRVESVTWIAERKDVMSGCFFLLTIWSYAAYAAHRTAGNPARGRYALTLALFAAGLMCKPALVTLPLLLLVLDWWPLRSSDGRTWTSLLVEKLPFFLLSIAAAVATIRLQAYHYAFTLSLPFDARLGNAVVSIARYLGKFFWPHDLIVCYAHPGYWPAWAVTGAAILTAAITGIGWAQRKAIPPMIAGWLWFLVMLLPSIGLVQAGFQSMADRYSYVPILGLQLAVLGVACAGSRVPALRAGLGVGAAIVLAASAGLTWHQQGYWRSSLTLFTHAAAVDDRNDMALGFLSYTLAGERREEDAAKTAGRALELNPHNETALLILAKLHAKRGQAAEAIAKFRTILEFNPDFEEVHFLLGQLLLQHGDFVEAVAHLRAAVKTQPQYLAANRELAAREASQGRTETAVLLLRAAVELEPDDAGLRVGLAELLARRGRFADALAQYERAVQLRPGDAELHASLGYMLVLTGRRAEAVAAWTEALRLNPDLPGLRARLEKLRAETNAH
jgi:Flp pilus assembly protein TadD